MLRCPRGPNPRLAQHEAASAREAGVWLSLEEYVRPAGLRLIARTLRPVLLSVFIVGTAWAAADEPTITLQPASLDITVGGQAVTALLHIRNGTNTTFSDLVLTTYPDEGFKVATPAPAPIESLAPATDEVWALRIEHDGATVDGRVLLVVRYSQSTGSTTQSRSVMATLTLKMRPATEVSQLADVEIKTTLESLDEHHPGAVYLVVTNKSDRPLIINPIEPHGPGFVVFEDIPPRTTLSPREVRTLPVTVRAGDLVRPGKHLLVFGLPIERQIAGRIESARIVSTKEVSVGVLGESEVLKLLGLPSFLLLPGFLFLVTFAWLWNETGWMGDGAPATFPVKATTPEFWVVAVTASGIVAYVYRLLTGRDYLVAYGLKDVINVWLLSIFVFGAGLYLILALGVRGWNWWWSPSMKDEPVDVLRKLHRRGVGVYLKQVELKGPPATRALLMESVGSRP